MTSNKRLTYAAIEKRAYELWDERGRPQGYESEFWAEAERALRLEASPEGTSEESGREERDSPRSDGGRR
jgi:hypothetical protein